MASYTVEDQERMRRAENYFAWQKRLVENDLGRKILEVGCGLGNFTGHLLDREAVIAVDEELECVERLKRRYGQRENLHVFAYGILDPEFHKLERFRADCCVCLNVLEHIQDDVAALRAIASVLAPRGVIVLLVPAFQALYGPIDRNLNHYRRYSRAAMERLAKDAGLRIRRIRYANVVGFFGWWINAHVLRRQKQSELQIDIFDRWVVPAASRVERVIEPPFGQSLIAVLEKP